MINLASNMLASFTPADETGVSASNSANHPLVTDLYFGIRMRVRQHLSSTTSDGGTCNVVAIDNTPYNNVDHHPDWDGGVASGQDAVVMVDIKELQTENTTIAAGSNGQTLPQPTINVASTAGFPSSGTIAVVTSAGASRFANASPSWRRRTQRGLSHSRPMRVSRMCAEQAAVAALDLNVADAG